MKPRLVAAALAAAAGAAGAAVYDLLRGRDPSDRAQPTPADRSAAAERILTAEADRRIRSAAMIGTVTEEHPAPPGDTGPEQIGRELGQVLDLVDEYVGTITDAQVEQRLQQTLDDHDRSRD